MKTIEIPDIFLYSPSDKMENYLKSQTLIAQLASLSMATNSIGMQAVIKPP